MTLSHRGSNCEWDGSSYFYHPGFSNHLQQNQPRTLQVGYQAFVVGDNLPSYYHTSERFIQLPSTGN